MNPGGGGGGGGGEGGKEKELRQISIGNREHKDLLSLCQDVNLLCFSTHPQAVRPGIK